MLLELTIRLAAVLADCTAGSSRVIKIPIQITEPKKRLPKIAITMIAVLLFAGADVAGGGAENGDSVMMSQYSCKNGMWSTNR
jgi:hypothetical protein